MIGSFVHTAIDGDAIAAGDLGAPGRSANVINDSVVDDLVGPRRVVQRDRELFWADVEILAATTRPRACFSQG